MKILIIQTAFIGDVILATPLIEKLRRFFPDATIDFLLRKGNEKLLLVHPHLRKVLIWNKLDGKLRNGWQLLRDIRSEKYDLVVNCQRFLSSGIFTVFSGAGQTVGFDKNPLSFLFSKKIRHRFGTPEQPIHEVDRNLGLIEFLTNSSFEKPRLYPSEADFQKVSSFKKEKYVTIAPTSVWFTKQWPGEKWVGLIGRLPAETRVFLLGGKADFDACEKIRLAAARPGVENLSGQLSFLESAALIADAAMNYVNDSAPMHMASAMNAPVTAVFCSTIPAFGFTPLSDRSFVVETAEKLTCRPCGLHGFRACPEGHFQCGESVDLEQFRMDF